MSDRPQRLVELMSDVSLDLMLVTDLVNVRYLTGYSGSNGLALVGPETRTFITDFRYVEQAAAEVDSTFERRRAQQNLTEDLPTILPEGSLRLGFEASHMTVREHERLRELLPSRVELVGVAPLVEALRVVKDASETEAIRAAAGIADEAFKRLIAGGLTGRTERQLALSIEQAMLEAGATHASFDTIVAAGAHGALPHAQPRDVAIARGDVVVIDWGARVDGYCSDCTRTVVVGEASERVREVYEIVLKAQLAGLEAVHAGQSGRAADAAARGVIESAGHAEHFGHGLGHGVGLDIHESPRLSARSDDELRAGNVVTVEPGIYLPGEFGIRIEDLVTVTPDGCQVLGTLGKELLVTE
jgi:Xaa-Pro aminopeptidase